MQLAKGYDPHAVEQKWYAHWEARGYFRPEAVTDPTGPPFVMVIPPPNVTGSLHMGHALNNTLQDIQARYHRMNGRPVLWLPGTDHAGIATQVVVERQLPGGAAERRAMGREAFAERVWAWKAESGSTITRQLRRLGVSCDWTRERFTLDDGLSRAVREVFVTLYEDGLVYRGNRLINWCVACQTALSDLEVEYSDGDGTLYHLRYGDVSVATVRPETKLGDTGLAVHPDDERYRHLVGTRVTFATESGELTLPVIADEAVDPAFGTGVVKVTPAHDPADWEMGERHGLEVKSVIGPDGRMTEAAGAYAGLDRFECRARIVDDLRARGLLEREEPYRSYARSWQRERSSSTSSAFVPLLFEPGEAYQFDWSHEIVVINGVTVTVKVAHVRLCHSRMLFVRAYPRESQEMVFDAHDRAFAFFKAERIRSAVGVGSTTVRRMREQSGGLLTRRTRPRSTRSSSARSGPTTDVSSRCAAIF
jgi:valyl-tRNA synthetase